MQRNVAALFFSLAFIASAIAQTSQQPAHAPITPRNTEQRIKTENLPSEATVNSFLKEYFGYESGVTWKILSIRPSAKDPALAEINVLMSGPQGQQPLDFYVTPDEKHAVVGELIPFGAHPFTAARQELQEKANGPSRPGHLTGDHRRIQRPAVPALQIGGTRHRTSAFRRAQRAIRMGKLSAALA